MITLNKSDKDYSPTTMYNDYSINETLFHWQSQSTTSAFSPTGQRYIHHVQMGSKVLLFVREFKTDNISAVAEAYTFLGPATYVKHEGSRPMNITWRLEYPIPARFLKKTNKLLVGWVGLFRILANLPLWIPWKTTIFHFFTEIFRGNCKKGLFSRKTQEIKLAFKSFPCNF